MNFFLQSASILSAIIIIGLFKSVLLNFSVIILAILIIFYIVIPKKKVFQIFNFSILTVLILLFVISTGSISSPLFFLLYFLNFGVAFIFDPKVVFVFTAGLLVLFFPEALKTDLTKNLIMLFSLIFLSPIAYFFGKSFQENRENNKKIETMKKSAREIENDIEDILYDDSEKLDEKEVRKLNKALLEAESVEEISDKR